MILCFLLGRKSADTVVILKKAFKDNAIKENLIFTRVFSFKNSYLMTVSDKR